MKTIKKFWGVVFIVALLSTLLIGAVPQAAAVVNNYAWDTSRLLPSDSSDDTTLALVPNTTTPADGFSILAAAQAGSTMVCTATDNAGAARIYKSSDGGDSWSRIVPSPVLTPPAAGLWTQVAIAPDNPAIIAVVSNDPAAANIRPSQVWLTKNGGATWAQLGALTAGAWINDIAIAPSVNGLHNVTVCGNTAAQNSGNLTYASNSAYLVTYKLDDISPAWAAPTGWAAIAQNAMDNVMAVEYSTNYLADFALLSVTYDAPKSDNLTEGRLGLHCYSYNTNLWDALVEASFPRVFEAQSITTANASIVQNANISLDPNFFLGDQASQIGFIGTTIQSTAANVTYTNIGGIYRLDYTTIGAANTLAQIYTGAINSVAWDGTNLMSADRVQTPAYLKVRRSVNALVSPAGVAFSINSNYKSPGTGNGTILLFNATSGLGLAFSQGNGACIAKTTDYGKSFNGYALVNSHFNNLQDIWMNDTSSVIYALTTDNVDMNLWKGTFAGFAYNWERVFILSGVGTATIAGDPKYMVRADNDDPDNVYIGLQLAKTMFKSTDGGINWSVRSCSQNIQDFVVQDANTVYVAQAATGKIVKTTAGGLSWSDPPKTVFTAAFGNGYSFTILADNQILLGSTGGGVAYTTDGDTWTCISKAVIAGGNTLATATGLENGDTIFASSNGFFKSIASWVIGSSHIWEATVTTGTNDGLVYTNGVLYAYDSAANDLRRWLTPTSPVFGAGIAAATDLLGNAGASFTNAGKPMLNILKATTGTADSGATTTTLWARSANENKDTADELHSFTEYLTSAADAPTLSYPIDNIIPVNSISGAISTFNYVWNAPPSIADTGVKVTYNYNMAVYLDSAGTNIIAGSPVIGQLANNSTSTQLSLNAGVPPALAAGTTYYWRVRVDANAPMQSHWSPMGTFVVEQLVAVVPVIASPANGGEVNTVNPAFSWSPISNATGYRFELSTTANFSDIVYTVDPATAGASVPSTITLTRGAQYFWHVKTLTPLEGEWSATANFIVAELPPTSPTPTTTIVPTPTITAIISQPADTTTVITVPPAETKEVNPSYIWAIIIVGAVLVIAVIILIVRTRRSV